MREVREAGGGGADSLMRRLVYSDEELVVSLSNTLKIFEHEQTSLWTRIQTWLFKRPPSDEIEIDGMRAKQLYDMARTKPQLEIKLNTIYALQVDVFRALLRSAKSNMAQSG